MEAGDVVHVGTPPGPPGPLSDWVIKKVHFHGFAGLPTTGVAGVHSPEFSCFGHQWTVAIYPGGRADSFEGYLAAFLYNRSPESIAAGFKIVLKHPTDRTQRSFQTGSSFTIFGAGGSRLGSLGKGYPNFAGRETLLTYLDDNGTLKLEIHLRTSKPTEPASFVPSNPFCKNMLKVFNNEEKSDVRFEVGGEVESATHRRKRDKTAATTFYANHLILDENAPALADMCRPGDETAVPINGVDPEIFKVLLYFCYGGTIKDEQLTANAKAIIEAADRFGIVNLKLQAEAVLTKETEITVENMLDNLLYANSKNLALFQEKIIDFVAGSGSKLLGKVFFDDVPGGSLISDVLTAFAQGKMSSGGVAGRVDDLKIMRVHELRKRLHDKGLCIDGSRETMIALLEENLAISNAGVE